MDRVRKLTLFLPDLQKQIFRIVIMITIMFYAPSNHLEMTFPSETPKSTSSSPSSLSPSVTSLPSFFSSSFQNLLHHHHHHHNHHHHLHHHMFPQTTCRWHFHQKHAQDCSLPSRNQATTCFQNISYKQTIHMFFICLYLCSRLETMLQDLPFSIYIRLICFGANAF